MKALNEGPDRQVSGRHIGSLVSDFHRNLMKEAPICTQRIDVQVEANSAYSMKPTHWHLLRTSPVEMRPLVKGKYSLIQPESLHQRCGW